jgi:hypothetical protein
MIATTSRIPAVPSSPDRSDETAVPQHGLTRSAPLHLLPGAAILVAYVAL